MANNSPLPFLGQSNPRETVRGAEAAKTPGALLRTALGQILANRGGLDKQRLANIGQRRSTGLGVNLNIPPSGELSAENIRQQQQSEASRLLAQGTESARLAGTIGIFPEDPTGKTGAKVFNPDAPVRQGIPLSIAAADAGNTAKYSSEEGTKTSEEVLVDDNGNTIPLPHMKRITRSGKKKETSRNPPTTPSINVWEATPDQLIKRGLERGERISPETGKKEQVIYRSLPGGQAQIFASRQLPDTGNF